MPGRFLLRSSRAGRCLPATPESGVTLVEMLVTLSIAALSAVLIMMTARPADPLRSEGEQLSRTLDQLDARARISGKPVGLVLDRQEYEAVMWEKGGWSPLAGTRHALHSGVFFRLPDRVMDSDSAGPSPALIFDPLGHSTLAPVTLKSGSVELVVSPLGKAARGPR